MSVQIVCGMFREEGFFEKAMAEFLWSLRQNSRLWKEAVLYVDPDCQDAVRPFFGHFRDVVVDRDMPEIVRQHKRWSCKGRWAKDAVDRFDRILYCDFDIYVHRFPDEALWRTLGRAPRFLYMCNYKDPVKVPGCGCVYYDGSCPWGPFLESIYHKWYHDEKAWTEVLALTKEKQLAEHYDMNPFIVNWDWLVHNPERRNETYLIHGISAMDYGRRRLRAAGYSETEISFHNTWKQALIYRLGLLRDAVLGRPSI
jgi:hypothetical protein